MAHQLHPDLARPGDDVHHPGWQVGLANHVGEQVGAQRGGGRRLEDDGVAGRQGRRDLPGQHQEREVPRDDLRRHAQRTRVAPREGVVELVGPAAVIEEVGRGQRHVDVAALLDRLAGVHRLDHGELAGALLDDPRDAVQVLGALAAGEPRPGGRVSATGGRHRTVDIGLRGSCDLGQPLLGSRVDDVEGGLGPARHEAVVDEEPVLRADLDVVGRLGGGGVLPRHAALGQSPGGGRGPGLRLLGERHAADYAPASRPLPCSPCLSPTVGAAWRSPS